MGTKTYNDDREDEKCVGGNTPAAIAGAQQPCWQGGISFLDDDEAAMQIGVRLQKTKRP